MPQMMVNIKFYCRNLSLFFFYFSGNCPGNRCKRLIESRVIDGEVYGRICCCEPTNNKWVKEFPCADPPKYV